MEPKTDYSLGRGVDTEKLSTQNVEYLPPKKDGEVRTYEEGAIEFAAHDDEWHSYKSKQLLRKVDLHLLPWVVLMYMTNFLDRTALAQARLGTLEQDLNLKGLEYNTITSILFVVSLKNFTHPVLNV